jgi:hypothetical protein
MRFLYITVLALAWVPMLAQSQKPTGTVTATAAEFTIPLQRPANDVWTWNRAETPDNASEGPGGHIGQVQRQSPPYLDGRPPQPFGHTGERIEVLIRISKSGQELVYAHLIRLKYHVRASVVLPPVSVNMRPWASSL